MVTNSVTYLNDVLPSVYFYCSQAFNKVPHTLLLDKLNNFLLY
jgi:hypothetical protein